MRKGFIPFFVIIEIKSYILTLIFHDFNVVEFNLLHSGNKEVGFSFEVWESKIYLEYVEFISSDYFYFLLYVIVKSLL